MQSIDDRYIDSTPTLNDTFSDANVFPASVTADPAAWQAECDAAFGYDERQDPTREEEEKHYASYMAGHVGEMKDDELAVVMDDDSTPDEIRHLCQLESIRRLKLASSAIPIGSEVQSILLASVQAMLAMARAANVRAIDEGNWSDGEYKRTSELREALAVAVGYIGVNARRSA